MYIESHGIDAVPTVEKTSTGTDLFMIWAGASLCLPAFVIGSLLVPAFSWNEALLINLLGNLLIGILIVWGGYFGIKTGQPAVVWGRQVFGYRIGQWIPTLGILLSMLGWAAVIIAMTGIALDALFRELTGYSSPLFFVILVGILNASTAVPGYQNIRRLSWITVPIMIVVCVLVGIKIFTMPDQNDVFNYQATQLMSFGAGLNLIIGGSISGALIASDFSRYSRTISDNWLGVLPGTFLVSFLLGMLGMIAQAKTGNWNPLLMIQETGMGTVVFIFMLIANWTSNDNLLYSSGLALNNLLTGLGRCRSTLVCAVLATIAAAAGITAFITDWLNLLSWLLAPLLGVFLCEFFIVKRRVEDTSLNIKAVGALTAGILIAVLTPAPFVPSASGLLSSALIYFLLSTAS